MRRKPLKERRWSFSRIWFSEDIQDQNHVICASTGTTVTSTQIRKKKAIQSGMRYGYGGIDFLTTHYEKILLIPILTF